MGQLTGRGSEGRLQGVRLLRRQPRPDRRGPRARRRDNPPRLSVSRNAQDQRWDPGINIGSGNN